MAAEHPSLLREFRFLTSVSRMADDRSIIKIKGSEEMSLVQLFVPTEVAHDAVAELGERGNVQFIDVSQRIIYMGATGSS
jgi:hypothetical protein